jgi:hypothetical protein
MGRATRRSHFGARKAQCEVPLAVQPHSAYRNVAFHRISHSSPPLPRPLSASRKRSGVLPLARAISAQKGRREHFAFAIHYPFQSLTGLQIRTRKRDHPPSRALIPQCGVQPVYWVRATDAVVKLATRGRQFNHLLLQARRFSSAVDDSVVLRLRKAKGRRQPG